MESLVAVGERIADALEKLASDREVEIEAGPPLCPSCGKLDPEILLPVQQAARGPLSQVVVEGQCAECHQPIYVVIESYACHRSRVTAEQEMRERERAGVWSNE